MAVLSVGGGDGATTTDGEIPRRIVPVRGVLLGFGLETITGFVAEAFANALGVRERYTDVGTGDDCRPV